MTDISDIDALIHRDPLSLTTEDIAALIEDRRRRRAAATTGVRIPRAKPTQTTTVSPADLVASVLAAQGKLTPEPTPTTLRRPGGLRRPGQ